MFYQVALLCFSAAAVLAAPADVPLEKQQPTVIPIISQSEELEPNGTYKFSYETANGIKREETSYIKIVPKPEGRSGASNEGGESDESEEIQVQQGSYSYTAPDGSVITVRYIADENGFQAFGDHLPRAPVAEPAQASVRSGEKSGRALKSAGNAEAPAPAGAAKPEPAPESAQSQLQAQEPSSVPVSDGVAPVESTEVESKSAEVTAEPKQAATIADAEPSSTTIAAESTSSGAEQATSASDASQSTTVAAEQATANVEVTTAAAEQPAPTAAVDQAAPATPENAAPVASDEQPTSAPTAAAAEQSVPTDQTAAVPITEQSVPEEPASTTVSA